ncbi:MAG TPA: acyltransferase [Caulobacteraceae bacterium]|jgi:peptidoglycan/LPS O-acetylase OafA/YrhL|nr:acyltransferase [Caulobacteraceae bacterium]
MQQAAARRSYQTLDGLRGVGAFLVVMRHVPGLFGPIRVPESFLAVDLFYLVSGFVVAHAYGERLARGGFFWGFVKTRIIRLYPLYIVGLIVGVITAVFFMLDAPPSSWTPMKIAECVALGLLMIPRFPGLSINGTTLNGPIWTLLYELIANFVYAAGIRLMKTWVLLGIVAVCAVGVVFAEFHYHTLDLGYNLTDQWAALARVGFSFFTGVLIYRWLGERETRSVWLAWACVVALGFLLGVHVPAAIIPYYEIAAVLVGMPALAVAAARFEPGPLSGRLFSFVGLISYGVYIVHQPLGNLAVMEINRFTDIPEGWSGVLYGAVFLAFLVLLTWGLDRFYDAPVRAWLRARFMPARPRREAAAVKTA